MKNIDELTAEELLRIEQTPGFPFLPYKIREALRTRYSYLTHTLPIGTAAFAEDSHAHEYISPSDVTVLPALLYLAYKCTSMSEPKLTDMCSCKENACPISEAYKRGEYVLRMYRADVDIPIERVLSGDNIPDVLTRQATMSISNLDDEVVKYFERYPLPEWEHLEYEQLLMPQYACDTYDITNDEICFTANDTYEEQQILSNMSYCRYARELFIQLRRLSSLQR